MLRLGHLNLTVSDVERSAVFYRRWFGFDRVLADYPDGTRFVTDDGGFELGLHPGQPQRPGVDWHFGFLAAHRDAVRDAMSAFTAAGVPVTDREDTPTYAGFKCTDPDGYVIEVYCEAR